MKESNKDLIIGVLARNLGNEVLNSRICEIGKEIYEKLCIVNKTNDIHDVSGCFSAKQMEEAFNDGRNDPWRDVFDISNYR